MQMGSRVRMIWLTGLQFEYVKFVLKEKRCEYLLNSKRWKEKMEEKERRPAQCRERK